jgi:hypothetical protein
MATLYQDLKLGIRIMIVKPAFAITAILIIAIGIGASTSIFSIVNGVLLRPLPSPNSERLVKLWESFVSGGIGTASSLEPAPRMLWHACSPASFMVSAPSTHPYSQVSRQPSG